MESEASMISIEPLDKDNWYPVCRLSVSEEQKRLFPISNVYWIGISRYEQKTELFAIRKGDAFVGLVGCGYDEDGVSGHINPLMVDQRYQRQGIGAKAMELIVQYLIGNLHVTCVRLGHRRENLAATRLYERLGFEVCGETEADFLCELQIEQEEAKEV